ncbi:MAG: hypothetical protein HY905_05730 [Deltaproteobacteria bacterium]|nr:hypothetical protein [Deltaproteobacteria bacterium]
MAATFAATVLLGGAGCPTRPLTSMGGHEPPPPPAGMIEPGSFRPIVTEPSGRLYLTFQDELSETFRLVRMEFALDGEYAMVCGDNERTLDAREPVLVYDGRLRAGSHAVNVVLQYGGVGHGIFSYLSGYTFTVRASHDFELPAASFVALHARAYENGDVTTPIEDRPHVAFEDRSTDPPRVTPRAGCPWAAP